MWDEHDTALELYHKRAADLHAGRQPTVSTGELTVKDLANHLLTRQAAKMDAGAISVRHFDDCRRILRDFAKAVGRQRGTSDLRPEDFAAYRARFAKRLGVHALTRTITVVKGTFKHGPRRREETACCGLEPSCVFQPPWGSNEGSGRAEADVSQCETVAYPPQLVAPAWSRFYNQSVMLYVTEAIYTDGVLRPVNGLDLADQQRVRIIVEPLENGSQPDRAAAMERLRAGIARMKFRLREPLPTRDELHDRP